MKLSRRKSEHYQGVTDTDKSVMGAEHVTHKSIISIKPSLKEVLLVRNKHDIDN